jgi:hypothetical protein
MSGSPAPELIVDIPIQENSMRKTLPVFVVLALALVTNGCRS